MIVVGSRFISCMLRESLHFRHGVVPGLEVRLLHGFDNLGVLSGYESHGSIVGCAM